MKNTNDLDLKNIEEVKNRWSEIRKNGYDNENLLAKESEGKGLGVFTKKNIKKGSIIEYCHCIIPTWKRKYIHDPGILKYAYWGTCQCEDCQKHGNSGMILLGNGSIYNSAESQDSMNAGFHLFASLSLAVFVAEKDIGKDEEILTWWGQNYYDSWCKKR